MIFIYFIILLIIIVIVLGAHPKSAAEIGKEGEDATARSIGDSSHLIRNIYLPKSNGHTVEIDMAYVTEKGIFVIECKNYKGYIFGNPENANWTQTLNAGKMGVEKHHIYNPIWQNRSHVSALKAYLGNRIPMFSIVVFSDECSFKDVKWTEDEPVCHMRKLGKTMKALTEDKPIVLTESEVESICNRLRCKTGVTEEIKTEHIQDVNRKHDDPYLCPKCGGRLVLRTNRKDGSQFYGCSNYPRCRYTRRKV